MTNSSPGKDDRRKARRRAILTTFSLFAMVPSKGPYRLTVHDLSDLGIGFDLDIEGEEGVPFPLQENESLEVRLYLNQSLYIPLPIQVKRIIPQEEGIRRIGGEFTTMPAPTRQALASFLELLDSLLDVAKIDTSR